VSQSSANSGRLTLDNILSGQLPFNHTVRRFGLFSVFSYGNNLKTYYYVAFFGSNQIFNKAKILD